MISNLKNNLMLRIEEIFEMQFLNSFILSGIYLNEEEMDLIKDCLQEDDPNIGAQGRYKGVPIFKLAQFSNKKNSKKYNDILYTFIPMAIVN